MKNTRTTKHTKLTHTAITGTYRRISPATDEGVTLYMEDRVLRMRFSDEAEAQTWADRYGVALRPDGTSFWLDLSADTFNLYGLAAAWLDQYMAA